MKNNWFITVDAESDVIAEGMRVLSELRDSVEAGTGTTMPITWFVRFQRGWTESVKNEDVAFFEAPLTRHYDGFKLALPLLTALAARGDEIGWHYHAYNYVHRDDLSHDHRIAILRADMRRCVGDVRVRYPMFDIRSFRFGWFFVPDLEIYDTLNELGITADASFRSKNTGKPVQEFDASYLAPPVDGIAAYRGVTLFPNDRTVLIHDWNVIAHDFGWSVYDTDKAEAQRQSFRCKLAEVATAIADSGSKAITYSGYLGQ